MFKQRNGRARHNGSPAAMTRRAVVTTAAAVPLSGALSLGAAAAEDAVADLIKVLRKKTRRSCAATWIAGPRSPASRQTSR